MNTKKNRNRRVVFALALSILTMMGCAQHLSRMNRHFESEQFESAAKLATDDRELARTLAVWIVRDAAKEEAFAMEAIDILKQAGEPGRAALDTFAAQNTLQGRLALVALYDEELPDETMQTLCATDSHGDVRTACMREHYIDLPEKHLKERLLDTDPRVRLYAVKGLIGRQNENDEIAALLSEVLRQDPASKVRAEAAAAGKLLGKGAYLDLKAALDDPNQGVRLAALRGIADLGIGVGFKRLETIALKALDIMAVAAAAELSRAGLAVGRERLADALTDDRPTIRIAALMRLERAGFPDRTTRITAMLEDRSPDVVLMAANLLRKERSVRPQLLAALRRLVSDGGSHKDEARDQLAVLGDEQAVIETREAMRAAKESSLLLILSRTRKATALYRDAVMLMGDSRPAVRLGAAQSIID